MENLKIAFASLIVAALLLATPEASARKHKTYVIKKGDTPASVSKKHSITAEELLRYNNLKPDGGFIAGYKLTIPFPGEVTGSKYLVKPGDSIAKVADFHGVSQDDLRAANGMGKGDKLQPGQELSIPYELRSGAAAGHVIKQGDTLASIAKKHGISIKALAAANKLGQDDPLSIGRTLIIPDAEDDAPANYKPQKVNKLVKSGEKVAGGVKHTVQPGQSLWIIARAYNTSGAKIAKANGFTVNTPINVGDVILIPGAKDVVPVRVKGYVVQPVLFVSVWNNESANLRLLGSSGKINQRSRKILSKLAGPKKKTKRVQLLHPRLVHMLQRVVERFPGHAIEIISGYRPRKRGAQLSKHNQGRALDFRVRGISNSELYEFIKELPKVGAGYYPNSLFVHMDVRDKNTLWTDYSGVGEAANYAKPSQDANLEALSDSVESTE